MIIIIEIVESKNQQLKRNQLLWFDGDRKLESIAAAERCAVVLLEFLPLLSRLSSTYRLTVLDLKLPSCL